MKESDLSKRMRGYESAYDITLTGRMPVIIRVDGRAFHTLTRKMEKPFDARFVSCMNETARFLCAEIQGAQIAFVQSDEITVFVRDYDKFDTQPWFSNRLQKMCSLSAGLSTNAFNFEFRRKFICAPEKPGRAVFDSKVYVIPREEVGNVFVERQMDCVRNSILMVGQYEFGKKKIRGWSCRRILSELSECGRSWDSYPAGCQNGRIIRRATENTRIWNIEDAPDFVTEPEIINRLVWPEDEEGA